MRDQLENTYRSHRQGFFSLALSITGCRQLAEDAVHSAFERLCRLSAAPTGDLTNYVFASVRNAAWDLKRQRRRTAITHETIFNGDAAADTQRAPVTDDVLTVERDQILRDAVDKLEEDDREVVVMKVFAGLTFEAIGEILQQPAKTVATRYRRALMKLEARLRGQL